MSHQFKPGDLALTKVYDAALPAGSQVELVRYIAKGELVYKGFRAPTPGWICAKPGITAILAYGEHELIPLRGDFAPEQQKAREAQPCA
jgi:hypothetical protein